MSIKFTVLGQPVSMKNQRVIVRSRRGVSMLIKSPHALQYEGCFLMQIPSSCRQCLDFPVSVTVTAYYASRRPDLDCELICDCLQKGGVLKNDRLIIEKHFKKKIDRSNPRCEIEIFKL